jgi:TolB-like protein
MGERTQRRLAAIVSTDVVGYSRLIGTDETGTLARMKAYRQELWSPEIEKHDGRVVGTAGDALLVEFASAVSAVESSLSVQQAMAVREADQDEERRMLLRIGINIGEVVVDGDDIHGDGVNVAARLQAIAPPGGICISGKVHDEVEGKIAAAFEDAGEQEVKNITRPVRVWRWQSGDAVKVPAPNANAAAEPSDKPSIAVLAFNNMSGDPEQEYFSDGISEDIITALAKYRNFHVIARNSSFTYKSRAVDIKKIGRELGVRYVLEGSVRKAGNRVRITAQLIEAESGNHIWAERYDRDLEDIFDLQDEITNTIASAIFPAFETAELQRIQRVRPDNLIAWDLTLQASHLADRANREDLSRARELAQKAVELEPNNSQALAILSYSIGWQIGLGFSSSPAEDKEIGITLANRALQIDPSNAVALRSVGGHLLIARRFEESLDASERCVRQNPNFDQGWLLYACVLSLSGRFEEAKDAYQQGTKLSPRNPIIGVWTVQLALGAFAVERYEEALDFADLARRQLPDYAGIHRARAAILSALGRIEEAAAAVQEAQRLEPSISVATTKTVALFTDKRALDRYCDALERAGLPKISPSAA